jgi:CheY-like chemotaxis protein
MRLLLVEDNQADVFLVRDALRQEGVEAHVEVVNDGEHAIALIRGEADFDCFLVDFNLPRQGGAEVLLAVRQLIRYADAPVVMMTSLDASDQHAEMKAAGATEVFVKPFMLSDFRNVVRRVVELFREHHARKT